MRVVLAAVAAWFAASAALAQPAFPGAEGFGAETRGGRGGRVIEVTNLNDDGEGSLRAAVATEGPRIVVFRVAGTIRLARPLTVRNPFITIAGQSAPGQGIALRDYAFVIEADEVIVRYIRARLGDESRQESDAFTVSRGRNIIVDHVSASWSVDETLSVSARSPDRTPTIDNVTVQWSIISESLNESVHAKGSHGYGSLIRGSDGARYSFHHNLWASHHARMPRPGNYESPEDDPTGPLFDFVNNVFYNWGNTYSGYNADENNAHSRYNFINNYYVAGPNSEANSVAFQERSRGARAYFAGNWWNGAQPADPWSLVRLQNASDDYRQAQPLATAAIAAQPANEAYESVLRIAGASASRDGVDRRVVEGVRDRTGRQLNSQSDVGGWPSIEPAAAPADSDHDGMSDAWERAHNLNPNNPQDGSADRDNDGYTNVEEALNAMAIAGTPQPVR